MVVLTLDLVYCCAMAHWHVLRALRRSHFKAIIMLQSSLAAGECTGGAVKTGKQITKLQILPNWNMIIWANVKMVMGHMWFSKNIFESVLALISKTAIPDFKNSV